ncbi:MAG: N-acetylmuramic acid 6-phosphate etherase [Candidatus Eremiobacteraeota bacterium]|nr:N-acetylmuramic acid 6-phosphate etherase [Candidatus Eremiobacteraeota bacterium]
MSERLPPTEGVDPATQGLDALGTLELVETLTRAHGRAVEAVARAAPLLAEAVDAIVVRLNAGATLHYVGAGTSGRLGVLDAAEQPPTFGTPPEKVRAHIAGGPDALVRAVEGAEDDAGAARRDLAGQVRSGDVVVGISASGGAAYVIAALEVVRQIGTFAIALTNAPGSPICGVADLAIVLDTGAEPLAGSTRMVAGTAQKIALNALSTAVMIRLGKTYDNLMVDLMASNEKLRRRALRIVKMLANLDEEQAAAALEAAGGNVKVAVVMMRHDVDPGEAEKILEAHGGALRPALEEGLR